MILLGISGKKRSGKNTFGNYFTGRRLKEVGAIQDFKINQDGKLIIKTEFMDGSFDWGILDLDRRDPDFVQSAHQTIWPFVKCYSFAEPLKEMVIDFFEVSRESVYGKEEQRNAPTHILWENMPGEHSNTGPMSGIEILQWFGTEVMRKIYSPVWVNKTINQILYEQPEIAIITDVRFPDEVKAIQKYGKVVRLTRNTIDSKHVSETSLDDFEMFDWLIDNSQMTHEEYIQELDKMYKGLV